MSGTAVVDPPLGRSLDDTSDQKPETADLAASITNGEATGTHENGDGGDAGGEAAGGGAGSEPMIDPELMSLPHPSKPTSPAGADANDTGPSGGLRSSARTSGHAATSGDGGLGDLGMVGAGMGMGITESIASAPNPRPTDFNPNFDEINMEIDIGAIEVDEDAPGSPTAKVMRAIAPPNAIQADLKWPSPPPNASVNLFIGRALLSNGNDNWPLKPNDIVNWIRKNYPEEWDGDEGRCSAHRVRTYLARKGADMYYEKLNQGCIAGWRIRQNHLWRFENGGFQGRGMKQEEAIAAAQKENEALATAAHKAAAAEALAAGHPSVKTSMSMPGVNDGTPMAKRQKTKMSGQARRRSTKKEPDDGMPQYYDPSASLGGHHDYSTLDTAQHHQHDQHQLHLQQQQQQQQQHHDLHQHHQQHQPHELEASTSSIPGPSDGGLNIDPSLGDNGAGNAGDDAGVVDMSMVHQAIAAAGAGQMDELEMGMQLPIEMQMHGGDHEGEDDARYRDGTAYYGAQGAYQNQFGTGFYNQGGYGYQNTHGQ